MRMRMMAKQKMITLLHLQRSLCIPTTKSESTFFLHTPLSLPDAPNLMVFLAPWSNNGITTIFQSWPNFRSNLFIMCSKEIGLKCFSSIQF